PRRSSLPACVSHRHYIFGAVCPKEGKGAALILPACKAMNLHLAEIAKAVAPCPCHPLGRSSWLALVDPPRRARQYHHHCAAAKMPRAQSSRKRLAVYARQLALEPRLQILRRSRRPLLQRLEQARRLALAHHVHWTAPMGAPVLIKRSWYKANDQKHH